MNKAITEIVGFDLGHGETAVTRLHVQGNEAPEHLEINGKRNQITAVARHPQHGVLVGESALRESKVTELHICFKGDPRGRKHESPDRTAKRNEAVGEFVRACHAKIASRLQGNGKTIYYVGCPSGWSESSRSAYARLLEAAGLTPVRVVAESRAAFLHAFESGKITMNETQNCVLIIDIGSSTTDFTVLNHLEEEMTDFGANDLGGALIEQALFRRSLEQNPARTEFEGIFSRFPIYRTLVELRCRDVKEKYFSGEEYWQDKPAEGCEKIHGASCYYDVLVDGAQMAEILREPQPTLDGLSWIQSFETWLCKTREWLDSHGLTAKKVILTGGPSRMKFTHELCRKIFPEADFKPDTEPEFCIARGLAHVGRYEARATAFLEEIETLCSSQHLDKIMRKHLPTLIGALVDPLTDGLIQNAFVPAITDWKESRIRTLQDLEGICDEHGNVTRDGRIATLAKNWLKGADGRRLIGGVTIQWVNEIQEELHEETARICRKFNISSNAMNFDLTPDLNVFLSGKVPDMDVADLEFITNVVGIIVALVIASILGGGGWALLMHGPIGWIIGIVIGVAVAAIGGDAAKEMIKTSDILGPLRKMPFLFKSIESRCADKRPEIRDAILKQLTDKPEAFDPLIATVRERIREELRRKADAVLVLVGSA